MKTTYHIIIPGSDRMTREVDWPDEPGHELLENLIEPIVGGPMEHVNVLFNDRMSDMFVHELGRLLNLPRNEEATEIYLANWRKQNPGLIGATQDFITGNAIIFDRRVWF
jgi:hypothetical protein